MRQLRHAVQVEVIEVASTSESAPLWPYGDHVSTEEQARRQGVKPIQSADDLALPGFFEDDAEYEEFLADLYASRRRGFA